MPLITADTEVEQVDVYESEARLLYIGNARTVRDT